MAFFDHKFKLKVHILQIILIHIVMGVSAPQLFLKGQPRTRANTIALGMGGKSMVIITYQILTEHRERFSRWRSYKAYAILNGLEIIFWAAVVFLIVQANIKSCVGISCTLRWVAMGVSIVINVIAVYMFIISYIDFRVHRIQKEFKGSRRILNDNNIEHGHAMDQLHLKPFSASGTQAPRPHQREYHGGEHGARRHSMSRDPRDRREQHSRKASMPRPDPSEHQARRHSISLGIRNEDDHLAYTHQPPRYCTETPYSTFGRK
ncbi:hypothetical protein H2204_000383 [Knufia peltigerae]|uniref:Uncharacterized protein n=1 Tax=Knufia peltigerae TaxID=1002370 RepID=A0AA38YEK6_9EURO|nr:hypothetical protein H2204_000383 [Knufia peltigerae]